MLQSMGLQRVRHDLETGQQQQGGIGILLRLNFQLVFGSCSEVAMARWHP